MKTYARLKSALKNALPDRVFLELMYYHVFKKFPNLRNPKTFNEKLQWLKLYDRRPEYTMMADKYAVRQYIADTIGKEYLIPLVGGPWDNAHEIDFDKLPEQFVLKTTHDCGVIICRDKDGFDIVDAREKLTEKLRRNYFYHSREWPYNNIPPRIIAEKYMVGNNQAALIDYKFFCFNGEPKAVFIVTDRFSDTRFDFFYTRFTHLPIKNGHDNAVKAIQRPQNYDKVLRIARILSTGIPHVRVDLFDVNGRIFTGELTFYHWGGFTPFEPTEWDYKFGEVMPSLKLSKLCFAMNAYLFSKIHCFLRISSFYSIAIRSFWLIIKLLLTKEAYKL